MSIKTAHGTYLQPSDSSETVFQSTTPDKKWRMISNQRGTSFSTDQSHYLRAWNWHRLIGPEVDLSGQCKAWEEYTLVCVRDNVYALKTWRGTYISATDKGNFTQTVYRAAWEEFTFCLENEE